MAQSVLSRTEPCIFCSSPDLSNSVERPRDSDKNLEKSFDDKRAKIEGILKSRQEIIRNKREMR